MNKTNPAVGMTGEKGIEMIRTYVVGNYLSENNKKDILEAAGKYGYDVVFIDSYDDAEGNMADGEVLFSSRASFVTQMPKMKWCHTPNAGVDAFIRSGVFDSGDVILTNSSGAYGVAIPEHIIMVTLMLMRRVNEYFGMVREGTWKHNLPIRSIYGSRIAIVGTGNIGQNTAERFKALGASRVTGFSRSGRAVPGFDEVFSMDDFEKNISDVDVLILCVPGTDETAGLLSAERIAALPQNVLVINIGRGTLVDQPALIDALNGCRIAGAALDVMVPEPLPADHPLQSARNCILTPHVSGDYGLEYTVDRIMDFFCENMKRYAGGEELIKKIDLRKGY